MAKGRWIQFNFTAGELSPLLEGRADLQKYHNGVKTLENFIVLPHGGAKRRPGTKYVAEVKDSTKKTRVIPFEFSVDQAYILEFGHQYIRVYRNGAQVQSGGLPVEVKQPGGASPPYVEGDLFQIKYAQSADVLYLVHPSYAPMKITRRSHVDWSIRTIQFLPPATSEEQEDIGSPSTTLTPGAVSGTGITFTANNSVFLAGDVGRDIRYLDSLATIKTFVSGTQVTADILYTFPDTNPIAAGQWFLFGSGNVTLNPSAKGPLGADVTVTQGTLTNVFRSSDVGKFLRLHDGVIEIKTYNSATSVSGTIRSILNSTKQNPDATGKGAWRKEVASWSSAYGYPGAICFFEDRLWLAGSTKYPHRFWGSKSGDYENLAKGFLDDDGIQFDIANGFINTIRWMAPADNLIIGTTGGEFVATGGNNQAITPDNIIVRSEGTYGSNNFSILIVGKVIVFVQKGGRKIRAFSFDFAIDSFDAADLSIIAEHTTEGGIVDLAYQQEPWGTVWLVRSDGVLVGLTYNRMEQVIAFHRHTTNGSFESVACIPHPDGDTTQVWFVVKRTINGVTKRYIEYFAPRAKTGTLITGDDKYYYEQLGLDCALHYDGAATATITGLNHLNGETVKIVGNGAIYLDKTVGSNQITGLDPTVTKAEVGFGFSSKLETLRPEPYGRPKAWANKLIVRLKDTLGAKINGQELPFRKGSDYMDAPPPLFTGDYGISQLGVDNEGRVLIEQAQALPITVLNITGMLDAGDN